MGFLSWLLGLSDRTSDANGARMPSERQDRSETPGAPSATSPTYLSQEEATFYFVRDPSGHLPVEIRVQDRQGWLVHPGTGRRVSPGNQALSVAGLFTFNVRGLDYYGDAVTSTDSRPKARAHLVREPANPHDRNAIAIQAEAPDGVNRTVGYVNKGLASQLAKRIDAGEQVAARFIRGSRPGHGADRVSVAIGDLETVLRL